MESEQDMARHSAPQHDEARQAHTLPLEKVMERFEVAGIGRSRRSLVRYCQNGTLDCMKADTATGPTYFVTEASVERAIQQISDMVTFTDAARHSALQPAMAGSDRHEVEPPIEQGGGGHSTPEPVTGALEQANTTPSQPDIARYSAPQRADDRFVMQLEKRIEEKNETITFLKEQLVTKDRQLTDLSDRFKDFSARYGETHSLLGAMQRMFAPLLGVRDPYKRPEAGENDGMRV